MTCDGQFISMNDEEEEKLKSTKAHMRALCRAFRDDATTMNIVTEVYCACAIEEYDVKWLLRCHDHAEVATGLLLHHVIS